LFKTTFTLENKEVAYDDFLTLPNSPSFFWGSEFD
jgi:hypothetical protein